MWIPETSTLESSNGAANASVTAESAAKPVIAAVAESTNSKPSGNRHETTGGRSENLLKGAATQASSDLSANPSAPSVPNTSTNPPKAPQTPSGSTLWFARPPTGGQFGPADQTTLTRWVHEKRVVADTYLWQEGWPEWRRAGDENSSLPEPVSLALATHHPPVTHGIDHELASVKLVPSEDLDHFPAGILQTKPRDTRKHPLRIQLLSALGLLLLVVVLLGILVWVLTRNPSNQVFAPYLFDGTLIRDWHLT
jgi:hypothetical protein